MKFSCTHEARDCLTPKSNSRFSASSRNADACSTVGAPEFPSCARRTLLSSFCPGGAVSLGSCADTAAAAAMPQIAIAIVNRVCIRLTSPYVKSAQPNNTDESARNLINGGELSDWVARLASTNVCIPDPQAVQRVENVVFDLPVLAWTKHDC